MDKTERRCKREADIVTEGERFTEKETNKLGLSCAKLSLA